MAVAAHGRAETLFLCLRDVMMIGSRLSEAFQRRLPSQESHGLGLIALYTVNAAGRRGLSQVELARKLGKSASSATRLIDSLERRGVLSREAHPSDRRIKVVMLTNEGQRVLSEVLHDIAIAVTRYGDDEANRNSFNSQLNRLSFFSDAIVGIQS